MDEVKNDCNARFLVPTCMAVDIVHKFENIRFAMVMWETFGAMYEVILPA